MLLLEIKIHKHEICNQMFIIIVVIIIITIIVIAFVLRLLHNKHTFIA